MTIFLLSILWLVRTVKADFFWIYLLQLKEYRLDRFRDHLKTGKGLSIVLNYQTALKVVLFFGLMGASFINTPIQITRLLIFALVAVYIAESVVAFKKLQNKSLKLPKKTTKAIILTAITVGFNFLIIELFLNNDPVRLAFYLLGFDLLQPFKNLFLVGVVKPLNFILKRKLFAQATTHRAELKNLLVIGVTGSYGKTTTKEMLATILESKFNVVKTREHENTEVAIAKFVLESLSSTHEIFICEMGAYREGEIKTISDIVQPKIGVFVGANEQHLALFGSMEKTMAGEGGGELLNSLSKGALGVFNGNNSYSGELYHKAKIAKRICRAEYESYHPVNHTADIYATNIMPETNSVTFKVHSRRNPHGEDFKLNMPGEHNIENLLLCINVAEELGMSLKEISAEVKKIKPMERSMSLIKGKNGLNIIDSTYSSNPNGVKAHLNYLKLWGEVKKIVIMPCLIELGPASEKIHREIGELLFEKADVTIVTTRDQFDAIKIGFYNKAKSANEKGGKKRIIFSEDIAEIIKIIKDETKSGDVVLFEGRSNENIIKALKR